MLTEERETVTDAQAIERSVVDPSAFVFVFERHFGLLHSYLRVRAGDFDADDLAGQTFEIAFRRRGDYDRQRVDARPWLFGIAINLLHEKRRSDRRRQTALRRIVPRAADDDLELEQAEARVGPGAVRAALADVPDDDRDLLLLFACVELTYEECAIALGVPVGTVRSRLHRLRARLQPRLKPDPERKIGGRAMRGDEFERLREAWLAVPEPDTHVRRKALARLDAALSSETRRSTRRVRRPQILLAAALLLGLLGAVPALSGTSYERVIHWLSGEPPEPLVEHLERMDRGAPTGMEQHPIVGETGLVYERESKYGVLRIWLTPTKNGGSFCQNFEAPMADGKAGSFSGGCFPAAIQRPIEMSMSGGSDLAAGFINGRVAPWITRLELLYVNGGVEAVPLQNGFFAAAVDHLRTLRLTDHPRELVGYDERGHAVHRERVDRFYREGARLGGATMPPIAEVEQERPAIAVELPGGSEARLFLSPARSGGQCDRLAAAGTNWSWSCADPAELPQPIRFSALRLPVAGGDEGAPIIYGVVKPGLSLSFFYEDGDVDQVPLVERRFLVALPAERWAQGHRLSRIGLARDGQAVLEVPMATGDDSFYTGAADAVPPGAMIQIQNPTHLPVVSRLNLKGSHGEEIEFLVRLETPTHWYEILSVNGTAVSGSNLQWFKGDRDALISVGWQPMSQPEFDVPKPLSLFLGSIREPADAARIVYRDGSTEDLELARPTKPTGGGIAGWFAYEMTPARREKHPLRFEAVNATGDVIGRSPVPPGA